MKENINTKFILGILLVVAVIWAITAQLSSNDQQLLLEKNQELEDSGYEIKVKSKIVFYNSEELGDADWRSFEVFESDYYSWYDIFAKDNNNVYYGATKIKNADPDSFEILDDSYQKDNNKVYFGGKEIVGAHPYSFEIIPGTSYETYAKDHSNVYNNGEVLEGISPEGFKLIGDSYYADKDNVYYQGGYYSINLAEVAGANPKTFSQLEGSYYKDDKNIYYEGKILSSASVISFNVLGGYYESYYAKDALNVWYEGTKMSNADAPTFELIDSYGSYSSYAKDKNRVYYYGDVLKGENPLTFDIDTYDPWS